MQHQNSENHTCHSLQDSTQQHRCDARNYARSPNDNRRQKLLPQRRLKCGTNKFMFSHNATEQQKSPFQKNGNNRTYLLDKHCGEDNQKLGCHRRISSNSSSCSSTCSTKTEERYPISATMTNSGSQRPVFVPVVDVESQTASNDCLSHNIYDETDRNALFLENNNDNENDKQRIILNCRDGDHDSKKNITAKTLRLNNSPATTSTTMSSSASSASGDDFSGTIGSTDYSFGDDFELNISPSSPNQNYNHCCDDQTYYGCEDDCRNKFSSPSQNLKVHQHFVSSCNQRIAVTAKENVSIVYDSPHLPSSLKCTSQEKKRPRRMRVSMIRNIALFPSTSDIGHYSRLLGMFQKENPSRCNKNNQARTLVSSTPRIIQLFFIALVAVSVSITTFYVTKVSREGNSLNNIDNNVVPSAPVRIHAQRVVYTPKIYFVDGHAQRPIFPADQKRKISLLSQPETPVEYDPTRYYDKLSSSDPRIVDTIEFKQPYEEGDCVPHHNWQTTFHPTCNDIHSAGFGITAPPVEDGHEVEESAYLFGVKGWWRHAWKHEKKSILIPGSSEVTVLKTLRYTHNFEDNFYEHNRVDAVAMERLTHSPHIIDIYNFCGQSVVTEFANGPSLGYTADKAKRKLGQKIKIAAGIARGLSDIHSTDETPSIVHFDINPDNVISTNGMLKINDFNIAKFLKWNNNENRTCGFSPEYPNPQWRSPEEALGHTNLTQKVDVFSMGHIFFRIIAGHTPWNKLEPNGRPSKEQINESIQQGGLPYIPSSVAQSDDWDVKSIYKIMMECYRFDPLTRPSSHEVADRLEWALKKSEEEKVLLEEGKRKKEKERKEKDKIKNKDRQSIKDGMKKEEVARSTVPIRPDPKIMLDSSDGSKESRSKKLATKHENNSNTTKKIKK